MLSSESQSHNVALLSRHNCYDRHTEIDTERKRERQIDRQTDRQTQTQRDRQTEA